MKGKAKGKGSRENQKKKKEEEELPVPMPYGVGGAQRNKLGNYKFFQDNPNSSRRKSNSQASSAFETTSNPLPEPRRVKGRHLEKGRLLSPLL